MVAMNMAAGAVYKLSNNNVAKGMEAKQISTQKGRVASMAVDGCRSHYKDSNCLSMTSRRDNPWWEVKFGRVEIGKIVLWLWYDWNTSNWRKDIKVSIYDGGKEVWSSNQGNRDPGKILTLYPKKEDESFIRGDRVRIWRMARNTYLALGEVECYAMVLEDPYKSNSTDSVSVNSNIDGLVLTGIPSTSSNVPPGGGSLRGGSETSSLNSIETMFSEIFSRTSIDGTSSDIDVPSDTLNQEKRYLKWMA